MDISAIILTTISTIIGSAATLLIARRYGKKEIDIGLKKTAVEIELSMEELWGIRNAKLIKEVARLMEFREHDAKAIKVLRRKNEDLVYTQHVHEIELKTIKRYNTVVIKKTDVFLLDDDNEIVNEFEDKMSKISVVNFVGHIDVSFFLAAAKRSKPPIVIIDYKLDNGKTAEDVIKELGYQPRIFIISVNERFEEKFYGQPSRFFTKDNENRYITRIASEIVTYLTERI